MLLFAQALKDNGTPIPDIAKKLVIKSGKNAGQRPSVASLDRAFAEAGEAGTGAVTDDGYPLRPRPARIRQDGEPLTAGEAGLRGRLVAQSRAEQEGYRSLPPAPHTATRAVPRCRARPALARRGEDPTGGCLGVLPGAGSR